MSSLYLCVCGDDHVTCYMGADIDAGEQTGTQRHSGDLLGILSLHIMLNYGFIVIILWTVLFVRRIDTTYLIYVGTLKVKF